VKRRPALALLTLMAIAAASACSSGSGGQSQAPPTPTASVSTPPSAADLQLARLLVHGTDLPKGYTKDPATLGTSLSVSKTDSTCAQHFSRLNRLESAATIRPTAHARVSFSKASTGPFIRASALRYSNPADAAKVVGAVRSVFTGCPSFTSTNPVTKSQVSVTLQPLPFPHLGNESVATAARLVSSTSSVFADLVFVRTGTSVAFVVALSSTSVDAATLMAAVRAEVRRLAGAK
jgi:hypothetical protein